MINWFAKPTETPAIMDRVLIALALPVAVSAWVFGPMVLAHCAVALAAGAGFESVCRFARNRTPWPFADRSVPVTCLLIALAMPPSAPLWLSVVAVGIGVVLAKELYGGLGRNVFNPAMAGYAAVLAAYPQALTYTDATTGATALDALRFRGAMTIDEASGGPAFGVLGGAGFEWGERRGSCRRPVSAAGSRGALAPAGGGAGRLGFAGGDLPRRRQLGEFGFAGVPLVRRRVHVGGLFHRHGPRYRPAGRRPPVVVRARRGRSWCSPFAPPAAIPTVWPSPCCWQSRDAGAGSAARGEERTGTVIDPAATLAAFVRHRLADEEPARASSPTSQPIPKRPLGGAPPARFATAIDHSLVRRIVLRSVAARRRRRRASGVVRRRDPREGARQPPSGANARPA